MNSIKLCFFLVTLVLWGASAHAAEYEKMNVRMACSTPPGAIQAAPLDKLAEIVERESGGKITFEKFYGGVLGDEQSTVKQLRSDSIQIGVMAAGNLTPFAPSSTLVIMPYLFPQKEMARKFFSDKNMMDNLADRIAGQSRTRPLAWLMSGYRVLTNSRRPIRKLEDMQGLKWRVPPVELQLNTFRAWGVEPHPLSWIETFNGLQQGVIDGQENPNDLNRDTKFWEVQKYITNVHYMVWVAPILVSERWYRKLSPDVRELFDRAAREAALWMWDWAEEQDRKALQECLAHGMLVNDLEDEDIWIKKARSIWPRYYDVIGGKAVLDDALAIMGQN